MVSVSDTSVMPTAASEQRQDVTGVGPRQGRRGQALGKGADRGDVEVEGGGDDGGPDHRDQDRRDLARQAGEHEQHGERDEPDGRAPCRCDGRSSSRTRAPLRRSVSASVENPHSFGQLPDDDDDRQSVHVADLDLAARAGRRRSPACRRRARPRSGRRGWRACRPGRWPRPGRRRPRRVGRWRRRSAVRATSRGRAPGSSTAPSGRTRRGRRSWCTGRSPVASRPAPRRPCPGGPGWPRGRSRRPRRSAATAVRRCAATPRRARTRHRRHPRLTIIDAPTSAVVRRSVAAQPSSSPSTGGSSVTRKACPPAGAQPFGAGRAHRHPSAGIVAPTITVSIVVILLVVVVDLGCRAELSVSAW